MWKSIVELRTKPNLDIFTSQIDFGIAVIRKKPNSAIRHVAKVNLMNGLRLTTRLPGKGYLCSKYNRVLVEGGRANDLPGVGYTAIRGAYDFSPVVGKIKRR